MRIIPWLYSFPALLYGGLIATIGFTAGFGGFRMEAWLYLFLLTAAAVLLSMKKWWGALPGAVTGGIVIYLFETAHVHQHVNVTPLGIGMILYFAAMGIICYNLTKIT